MTVHSSRGGAGSRKALGVERSPLGVKPPPRTTDPRHTLPESRCSIPVLAAHALAGAVLGASCGLSGCWLVLWVLERRRQ